VLLENQLIDVLRREERKDSPILSLNKREEKVFSLLLVLKREEKRLVVIWRVWRKC
jgi:hypothetical protein